MKLKELIGDRQEKDSETVQIFQPPYMGGPRTPPPFVMKSMKETVVIEVEGKIIEKFSGNADEIQQQKNQFLKDRCLIFD